MLLIISDKNHKKIVFFHNNATQRSIYICTIIFELKIKKQ
jgi:hypothetical protein